MSERTPHGHLVSIIKRLATCERYSDGKGLEAYLLSDGFYADFTALDPIRRLRVHKAIIAAGVRCKAELDRRSPLPSSGGRKVRWKGNDALIAKLRALAPKYIRDEDLARALGIPVNAAKLGRYRYVGAKGILASETMGLAA